MLLLLFFTFTLIAGDYEKGIEAFQKGDYETGLSFLKPLAQQGDAEAQSDLGLMYYNGIGVSKDFNEALVWFRKAADQDAAEAQSNLGSMYYSGT